jgi:hypothetical protein
LVSASVTILHAATINNLLCLRASLCRISPG